jgi:gamma-glutamyltranspeptidase
MAAPRWEIAARESNNFNAWTPPQDLVVQLEPDAPESLAAGLAALGHETRVPGNAFGHAQLIDVSDDGALVGASDPRALIGSAAGY